MGYDWRHRDRQIIPNTRKKEETHMANELILAVDDEAHILELLSFNLEASGYRVVTAATG